MARRLRMGCGESLMAKIELFRAADRGVDIFGSGDFGAPRGDRVHTGTDFRCVVVAPVAGEVTKIGYPYSDDLSYRYVQITDSDGYDVRCFYVDPSVQVGDRVVVGTEIGTMQSLQGRYPGIIDHVHVEVRAPGGRFIPWKSYVEKRRT